MSEGMDAHLTRDSLLNVRNYIRVQAVEQLAAEGAGIVQEDLSSHVCVRHALTLD